MPFIADECTITQLFAESCKDTAIFHTVSTLAHLTMEGRNGTFDI